MNTKPSSIRDVIIGVVLLVIGAATLLQSLRIITFNDVQVVWFAIIGLLVISGLLLVAYFFQPKSIWILMLAMCTFFIASITYVLNFQQAYEVLIPTLLFLMTSLVFFVYFTIKPQLWWTMFIGWISLGLAGTIYTNMADVALPFISQVSPRELPALVLFTSIFLGFIFTWLTSPRERWWALLTAGMVAAVESVIVTQTLDLGAGAAPVFLFLVSGLTFLLVWFLKNDEYKLDWAIYPAIVLFCFSAFLYLVTFWQQNSKLVVSAMFMIIGALFLLNHFAARMRQVKKVRTEYKPKPEKASQSNMFLSDMDSSPKASSGVKDEEKKSLEVFSVEEAVATSDEKENDDPEENEEEDVKPPLDYAVDEPDEDNKDEGD